MFLRSSINICSFYHFVFRILSSQSVQAPCYGAPSMRFDEATISCGLIIGIGSLDSGMEATVIDLRDGLVAVWASRASAVWFACRGHHLQRDFAHPACVIHDHIEVGHAPACWIAVLACTTLAYRVGIMNRAFRCIYSCGWNFCSTGCATCYDAHGHANAAKTFRRNLSALSSSSQLGCAREKDAEQMPPVILSRTGE
jgi:hypothetical protein